MSSATMSATNLSEIAATWRNARRLYPIYLALNQECGMGQEPCRELESPIDRHDAESIGRVRDWLERMDALIQVHQLRQFLQSTSIADEEVLRALLKRQLDRPEKTDAVRDKVDYLLVQYYAYCAPQDGHSAIDHDHVAEVLEPILGYNSSRVPDSCRGFEKIIDDLRKCTSIAHLLENQIIDRARAMKEQARNDYFHPAVLVAHARLNFLMRRGLFRLIHADLHAIRFALHTMEARGQDSCDCSSAGLSTDQSFADLRELCHQWNRPSRASYSLGNTFAQLVAIRTAVEAAVARLVSAEPQQEPDAAIADELTVAIGSDTISEFKPAVETSATAETEPEAETNPEQNTQPETHKRITQQELSGVPAKEPDPVQSCIAQIQEVLANTPGKSESLLCNFKLGETKLAFASWEVTAFMKPWTDGAPALRRAAAVRALLIQALDKRKKGESVDVAAAVTRAHSFAAELQEQIASAKDRNEIDTAVHMAATSKRLLALVEQAEKGK